MTQEEAISIIENEIKCVSNPECDRNCAECPLVMESAEPIIEAFNLAIDAIKKQIPMKMPGTYTDYKCVICGRRIRSGKGSSSYKQRDNFCQRCGQAICWDE